MILVGAGRARDPLPNVAPMGRSYEMRAVNSTVNAVPLMLRGFAARRVQDAAVDTPAIETIINEYGAAISRLAFAFERNKALRDELTQEILLAIWQALPRFRHESSLKTFVLRIAHHRAVNHVLKESSAPDFTELDEQHIDSHADPSRQVQTQQQGERLLQAVQRLPLADKELVTLALEGLSHREIAALTGLTENHVAVKLSRQRSKLQQQLEGA